MSAHLPSLGGAPFSFSILRTVSRSLRSSSALAPTTWLAMIEDEAWPSAQAFTSWAKSVTVSPSIFRSTVTVDPHSLEWAVARGVGLFQPAQTREYSPPAPESGGCRPRSAWLPRSGFPPPVAGTRLYCRAGSHYIWRIRPAQKAAWRLGYGPSGRMSHAHWECDVQAPAVLIRHVRALSDAAPR